MRHLDTQKDEEPSTTSEPLLIYSLLPGEV